MTRSKPPLEVRPDLTELAPYVSPQQPARFLMNTNEAPYPPPPELVAEVIAEIAAIALNRYPDKDARGLVEAISERVGWPRDGVWVANGSNEVFMHLFLAFGGPGRTSMTFEPTYSLHTSIPRIAGTRSVQVPRAEDLRIDVDAAVSAIEAERPEIVIVCSPNNPTGDRESPGTLETLLDAAPGLVVVDEAYAEFDAGGSSAVSLLRDRPGLVVTKTFSKAWRLAGVRVGYMLAAPELIGELARVRLPYHLSAITQVIGAAALRHAGATLEMARSIAAERDRIISELEKLGVKTYPSSANFVLFQVEDADRTWKSLLERGVLVRNYSQTAGLERCLRVTAGRPEETDAFLDAIREALDD